MHPLKIQMMFRELKIIRKNRDRYMILKQAQDFKTSIRNYVSFPSVDAIGIHSSEIGIEDQTPSS